MDDEVFAALLGEHRAYMRGVAAAIVGVGEAEDVVQDALLLAWRKRATFDGRIPAAWLAAITRNRAIDIARRRRFVAITLDQLPERADPAREPEAAALAGAVGEAILMALGALTDREADAAWRCLGEGKTYATAAAELGVTRGAVRSRLHSARLRLRVLLAGWG